MRSELLSAFPAVVIQGARQVGKSTLARQLVEDRTAVVVTLDDRRTRDAAVRYWGAWRHEHRRTHPVPAVPVGELRPLRRQRLVDARVVDEVFRNAPRVDPDRFRRDDRRMHAAIRTRSLAPEGDRLEEGFRPLQPGGSRPIQA